MEKDTEKQEEIEMKTERDEKMMKRENKVANGRQRRESVGKKDKQTECIHERGRDK